MWSDSNPFLNGPFEPLTVEKSDAAPVVIGEIPPDLGGVLYRTGNANIFKPLNPDRAHWFDADGMTHAFILENGSARYVGKWVETDGLQAEREAGKTLYNGVYGVSNIPQLPLPKDAPPLKISAGINIVPLAGRVLALHEQADHYWEIDPRTLQTVGRFSFNDRYKGKLLTGHPHYDAASNENLFIAHDPENRQVTCFSVNAEGNITFEHTAQLPSKAWIHDFIASRDWFIFFLSPIMNNVNDGNSVAQGKGALSIDPAVASCIFLVNRKGGGSRTVALSAPTQVTHFLNAYQEEHRIVVDACLSFLVRTEDLEPAGELFPFNLPHVEQPAFSFPQLHRIVIDVTAESVNIQPIEVFGEFPRPNPKFQGIKHRYGYLAAVNPARPAGSGMNSLAKYDFESGKVEHRSISEGYDMIPGEPIFVERPHAMTEDDGWILQLWWSPVKNASELVIFDAQNIAKEPIARIQLTHHIPLSFHGNWISWAELGM